MRPVVFYISGHGYGHATRCIELISTLKKQDPDLFFHIKTDAPAWLFQLNLKDGFALHRLSIDVGAAQNTSFSIDKRQTLGRWQELLGNGASIVSNETSWLRDIRPHVIVGDIPPLAFEISAKAGIPSVALGNFSWDWIYQDYAHDYPEFEEVIAFIRQAYGKADLLLRLPFYGDLSAFRRIQDIPLIARRAHLKREQVRDLLAIDQQRTVVLVALRASDLVDCNLTAAFSSQELLFLTFGVNTNAVNSLDVAPDFIRFADLVNACDLVVSKPGYGIVSEIIANRVPLLYTSRRDFVEYDVLVESLKQASVSTLLPFDAFTAGEWTLWIEQLLGCSNPWPHVALDGAEQAAEQIRSRLSVI